MARIGRRRRVLNEEVLTAGSHSQETATHIPGDTPRYGAGANIENHPQVTDLVPRRYRVVALGAILALGLGCLAETVAHFAPQLSEKLTVVSAAELTHSLADRLVAWTSTTLLLLTVGYTRLIHSLRKHRVDDYRGRYRIWRTAGWAAIVAGFATITGVHTIVGQVLGHVTGWSLLPNSPGWWLVPTVLLGSWLLVRLAVDVAECRTALTAYVLAIGCFALAAASAAGFAPALITAWPDTPSRLLPLCGNTMLFAGSILFARYVVLDVQGLIEHAKPSEMPRVAESTTTEYEPAAESVEIPVEQTSIASESAWVDGSDPDVDEQYMSKAERKRQRKQKNRKRAA